MNVNATVHIYNARDVTTTITVWGQSNLSYYLEPFRNMENIRFKSLTFIYERNALRSTKPKIYAQNAIGNRQKGDKLLYFESRNVTNISRFPSRGFEYVGNEYITFVSFSFNVSQS